MTDGWFVAISSEYKANSTENRASRKYHYFENNESFCKAYRMETDYFDTEIESGQIMQNPNFGCKKCYAKWKREFGI